MSAIAKTLQRITYSKTPSNATLAITDPSLTRDAAAVQAAKLVVSRAQDEFEQLEKEREEEEAIKANGGKRPAELDEEGREAKRQKADGEGAGAEDDDEMEIEMDMEDDEDGESWVSV
jgi:hypothetical protein